MDKEVLKIKRKGEDGNRIMSVRAVKTMNTSERNHSVMHRKSRECL